MFVQLHSKNAQTFAGKGDPVCLVPGSNEVDKKDVKRMRTGVWFCHLESQGLVVVSDKDPDDKEIEFGGKPKGKKKK